MVKDPYNSVHVRFSMLIFPKKNTILGIYLGSKKVFRDFPAH
jgi:hypothetical protein